LEKAFADESEPRADPMPPASYSIAAPSAQTAPVVFASPHSGQDYPEDFIAEARLDPLALRRSEDAFVDKLFAAAPACGAPLLKAHFPRVFVDPNRQPYELDPGMFDERLPDFVNINSPRVAAGLGTVARVVTNGEEIYSGKLSISKVLERIGRHYFPYHNALQQLLETTQTMYGAYLLIDCHSMPSIGGPMDQDPGAPRVDFVLGDCYGTACAPAVTALVESTLRDLGFVVKRNTPYAGGFTTRHYSSPAEGKHTLQIEINRALYMDEDTIEPLPSLPRVADAATRLIEALTAVDAAMLMRRG
jgi:N-formylglutamate amidohydrolase